MAQLNKIVKKAHVDIWVGKSDHKVHRVAFSVDAAMDAATKQSQGIDSATVNLDVTTVDTERARHVGAVVGGHARRSSRPPLMGLLGKVMGGAAMG